MKVKINLKLYQLIEFGNFINHLFVQFKYEFEYRDYYNLNLLSKNIWLKRFHNPNNTNKNITLKIDPNIVDTLTHLYKKSSVESVTTNYIYEYNLFSTVIADLHQQVTSLNIGNSLLNG